MKLMLGDELRAIESVEDAVAAATAAEISSFELQDDTGALVGCGTRIGDYYEVIPVGRTSLELTSRAVTARR